MNTEEEIKTLIEEVEWQIGAVEKPSAINCNKMLEVIKQLQSQVKNNDLLNIVSLSDLEQILKSESVYWTLRTG